MSSINYTYSGTDKMAALILAALLLCSVRGTKPEVIVGWCSKAEGGAWQNHLADTLASTNVIINPEYDCGDLESNLPAVTVGIPTEHLRVIQQGAKESVQHFIGRVVSKICSYRVTIPTDSAQFDSLIAEDKETIVVYTSSKESPEHLTFCRAVLSPQVIMDKRSIVLVSQTRLLSPDIRKQARKTFQMWTVSHSVWSEVYLQDRDPLSHETRYKLIGYLKIFSFPSILSYTSDSNLKKTYEGSGLRYVLVFHYTDQLDKLLNDFIRPLSDKFRPYFAFITINGNKHIDKMSQYYLNAMTELPYIVVQEPNQENGLHINKQYISYSIESLSNLLESLVDPDISNQDAPPPREGISLSFLHVSALPALLEDESPVICVLCDHESKDCSVLHEKTKEAVNAASGDGIQRKLSIFIIEIEDIHDVENYGVTNLPQILVKSDHLYTMVQTDLTITSLIDTIKANARQSTEEPKPVKDKVLADDSDIMHFYNAFSELREDESLSLIYPSYSHSRLLPHLTSENASQFLSQSNDAVVAFYLPYCLTCRPMLYHISNVSDALKEVGMKVAVVNCAAYSDVCNLFGVSIYPTIKFKKGGGDWSLYEGVVSPNDILATLSTVQSSKDVMLELTPSRLLQVLKLSDVRYLIIFCTDDALTAHEKQLFTEITQRQIYWLNSVKHTNILEKLVGNHYSRVLILIDYQERFAYHLHIRESTTVDNIETFFTNIDQGLQAVTTYLDSLPISTWPPFKPPVHFPSTRYTQLQEMKRGRQPHFDDHHTLDRGHRHPNNNVQPPQETYHTSEHDEL